jgi:hypothetical protein
MIGNRATRSQVMQYWPGLKNDFSRSQSLSDVGWVNYQAPTRALGNTQHLDFHLKENARHLGADIDELEAAQGKVKLLGVPQLTTTSAVISFVAPDGMGCPVDYSHNDAAVIANFTRVHDPGGTRARSIRLPGLAPGTLYHYRVNCAAEQPTGSFQTRNE